MSNNVYSKIGEKILKQDVRRDLDEALQFMENGGGTKTCTNATRPLATAFEVGFGIWNTDDNAFNYSDGTNWRDSMGALT